jgi:hypothetical protein
MIRKAHLGLFILLVGAVLQSCSSLMPEQYVRIRKGRTVQVGSDRLGCMAVHRDSLATGKVEKYAVVQCRDCPEDIFRVVQGQEFALGGAVWRVSRLGRQAGGWLTLHRLGK